MDSVLLPIPSARLDIVWFKIVPMLETALETIGGRLTLEDIRSFLEQKDWVLWVSLRNGAIEAIATTEVLQYPRKKMCMVRMMTGHDYFNWIGLEDNIAKWAQSIGCHGMEAQARKGWAKIFKNYDFTHIYLERMFID